MYVDRKSIEKARTADLHAFLCLAHPDAFLREGRGIRMKGNRSLCIKAGYYGYRDFSTGETGNGITFLMRHMGYSFQDAVLALCGAPAPGPRPGAPPGAGAGAGGGGPQEGPAGRIRLPRAAAPPYSRVYAYLMGRGIPKSAVGGLVRAGLLYQAAGTGNAVFVNRERDCCELRGTSTYAGRAFHGCLRSGPDRFWYFLPGGGKADAAYVTEAAIDAISLCLLHRAAGMDVSRHAYASMGGASNHRVVGRISRGIRTVLAVDNDPAGDECRRRHPGLEHAVPERKDWNEDLQALALRKGGAHGR